MSSMTPEERASRAAHPSRLGNVRRLGGKEPFTTPPEQPEPVQNTREAMAAAVDPTPEPPAPQEAVQAPSRSKALAALVVLIFGLVMTFTGIALWVGIPIALTIVGSITVVTGFLLGRDT